jgi:hypothetical protein
MFERGDNIKNIADNPFVLLFPVSFTYKILRHRQHGNNFRADEGVGKILWGQAEEPQEAHHGLLLNKGGDFTRRLAISRARHCEPNKDEVRYDRLHLSEHVATAHSAHAVERQRHNQLFSGLNVVCHAFDNGRREISGVEHHNGGICVTLIKVRV